MRNLGIYIEEYYQNNKYIGCLEHHGELEQNQVTWTNRIFIKDGVYKFKKKYTATEDKPIMIIKYNLQGR